MPQNASSPAPPCTVTASPLVCHLDVFDAEQRQRYGNLRQELAAAVAERTELPDGYALCFPADAALLLSLAEWITLERLCCPFLNFHLAWEAESGPIWLRLTGREGVKEVLRPAFGFA